MDALGPLLVGFLALLTVGLAALRWRTTRRGRALLPDPEPPGAFTVLRIGRDIHQLPGALILSDGPVLRHTAGFDADRDPHTDVASLHFLGEEHVLIGSLEPVIMQDDEGEPIRLCGVQGQFVSPPNARVCRERTIFVGTEDAELGARIVKAFAVANEPEADATIPWTLEGAARFASKYLTERGIAQSATVNRDHELEVVFSDGDEGTINLGNLFLNQLRDRSPTEGQEALQQFLDTLAPTNVALERSQLLVRIHRGVPPIFLEGQPDIFGQTVHHELASHAIGTDLCFLYVQDLPDRMRYLSVKDANEIEPDPQLRVDLAHANLTQTLNRIRILGDGPIYMVICGGNYEASLLCLPELWKVLDPLLDGDRLIAVPARDLLFVTGDASPLRRAQMMALTDPQTDLAYPVSNGVYRWDKADETWHRL